MTAEKLERLKAVLRPLDGAAVAFSGGGGGVDSTFLLSVCREALGRRLLAVTVSSATSPRAELERARALARELGVEHVVVEMDELSDPDFASNTPERCYHCKRRRYARLVELARQRDLGAVLEGGNASDAEDFRPGARAAREAGVRSPLAEAGLTKGEVRRLSKERSLRTWDLPPAACLASRVPYGRPLEAELLRRIDRAEEFLRGLGFKLVRVRAHGELARVEAGPEEPDRLLERSMREKVARGLRAEGFTYVAADLEGYEMGSLNRGLSAREERP